MTAPAFFKQQSRPAIVIEATALLLLVGTVDYVTDWELSVSLLYALVVLLVAWHVDRKTALIFAVASAVIWHWANLNVNPYSSHWGYAWATFTRLAYFVFVAIGGATFKAYQEANRARVEALERAQELEHEIARVSEREQRRIGQDLHDGICQSLAAVQYALSNLRDDLRPTSPQTADAVQEVVGMVKQAIGETRDLAKGIFPVQMEEVGLAAVLDEMVAAIRRLHRVDAAFAMQGDVRTSDPEVAMHLYRIAQEAVSNALKHSKATRIAVGLREQDHTLRLTVEDNGRGLPPSETNAASGMGLKTMRHRASLIGADLDIQDHPGGGVAVTCTLPAPATFAVSSNPPPS